MRSSGNMPAACFGTCTSSRVALLEALVQTAGTGSQWPQGPLEKPAGERPDTSRNARGRKHHRPTRCCPELDGNLNGLVPIHLGTTLMVSKSIGAGKGISAANPALTANKSLAAARGRCHVLVHGVRQDILRHVTQIGIARVDQPAGQVARPRQERHGKRSAGWLCCAAVRQEWAFVGIGAMSAGLQQRHRTGRNVPERLDDARDQRHRPQPRRSHRRFISRDRRFRFVHERLSTCPDDTRDSPRPRATQVWMAQSHRCSVLHRCRSLTSMRVSPSSDSEGFDSHAHALMGKRRSNSSCLLSWPRAPGVAAGIRPCRWSSGSHSATNQSRACRRTGCPRRAACALGVHWDAWVPATRARGACGTGDRLDARFGESVDQRRAFSFQCVCAASTSATPESFALSPRVRSTA